MTGKITDQISLKDVRISIINISKEIEEILGKLKPDDEIKLIKSWYGETTLQKQ